LFLLFFFYLLGSKVKYIAYKIVIFHLVNKKVNFPEIPEKIKTFELHFSP